VCVLCTSIGVCVIVWLYLCVFVCDWLCVYNLNWLVYLSLSKKNQQLLTPRPSVWSTKAREMGFPTPLRSHSSLFLPLHLSLTLIFLFPFSLSLSLFHSHLCGHYNTILDCGTHCYKSSPTLLLKLFFFFTDPKAKLHHHLISLP
jgi:hypothetical protein